MPTATAVVTWLVENQDLMVEQAVQHLNIALTGLFFGVVLWGTTGLLIHRYDRFSDVTLGVFGVLLTIPSLALLSLLIPLVGIGTPAAVTALVLYSALPIARNVYVGLESVDESSIEVGRGLGMTDRQLLFRVRFPQAMSVMMAGIRQAAVLLVAITTVTAFFGAPGLGQSIFRGISVGNTRQILGSAIVISTIAIVLDTGLYGVQRFLSPTEVTST
ncbi:ABC transporter permease [Halorubellus sp. PRR65]|uniref:ABC transporter permease n=1 Tax=Halorubellus sp. PRR65 TaxID=3098148 RepID=UPI002B261C03|nr:ABC transporter permease [Halorubellus sp. PRR65]